MRPVIFALLLPLLLTACGNPALRAAQHQVISDYSKQLPLTYQPGVVAESVHRHGNDVVIVLRFVEKTVAQARTEKSISLSALQSSEQTAMNDLCQAPEFASILEAKGGLRRRFIDSESAVFFEVKLVASDCVTSNTDNAADHQETA